MYIIYLKKKVLFPYCAITIEVKNRGFVRKLQQGQKVVVCPVARLWDYFCIKNVGVLAEVFNIEQKNNTKLLSLKGISRVKVVKKIGFWRCSYEEITNTYIAHAGLSQKLRKKAQELIFLVNVEESDKLIHLLNFISDAVQLSDFIANYFILDYNERVKLLNTVDVKLRIDTILQLLDTLIYNIKKKREREVHEKESLPG